MEHEDEGTRARRRARVCLACGEKLTPKKVWDVKAQAWRVGFEPHACLFGRK